MSTHRYARQSTAPAEKEQRKITNLKAQIAHTENVLAWQQDEGYTEQAAYSVKYLAKLNTKLAKLS